MRVLSRELGEPSRMRWRIVSRTLRQASMTNENWQPVQAQIRAIRWRASKLHDAYSDKLQHSGTVEVAVPLSLDYSRYTPAQLLQLKALIDIGLPRDTPLIEGAAEDDDDAD
jgi:hypothetical protein